MDSANCASTRPGLDQYYLHILILLWAFIYTGWSIMGRFGLVSLGHGAFLGIGAYTVTMLWNHFGVTPWLGIPAALLLPGLTTLVIGYPCFRFRITGHYFALVTLALSEVVRLLIIALRDFTGGSLGVTPRTALAKASYSFYALQFAPKVVWFYVMLGFWLVGLWIWRLVGRSMARCDAGDQPGGGRRRLGRHRRHPDQAYDHADQRRDDRVRRRALRPVQVYINPETVSGIAISLQIVFAVIAGGMFVQLGPTVGALFTILLAESLRIAVGNEVHGLDGTIYGLLLVILIIYMPKGILGALVDFFARPSGTPPPGGLRPAREAAQGPSPGRRGQRRPMALHF